MTNSSDTTLVATQIRARHRTNVTVNTVLGNLIPDRLVRNAFSIEHLLSLRYSCNLKRKRIPDRLRQIPVALSLKRRRRFHAEYAKID